MLWSFKISIAIWDFFPGAVPWRNGEDADLVFQWSAVQASAQEIFHSNSGYLTLPLLLTELSLLFNHGPWVSSRQHSDVEDQALRLDPSTPWPHQAVVIHYCASILFWGTDIMRQEAARILKTENSINLRTLIYPHACLVGVFFGGFLLNLRVHCKKGHTNQRYTHRVLQTIHMKLILLCVWAEPAVLGSTKTALKFKYEILIG